MLGRIPVGVRCAAATLAAVGLASPAAAAVTPAPNGRGTKGVGVHYATATVVIPAALARTKLKSVSADGTTYTFTSTNGPIAKLKPGSVMLIQGLAVRRVQRVAHKPSGFVVVTTPAAITDVLRSGTLSWGGTPINFATGYAVGGAAVPIEPARDAASTASLPARFGLDALSSHALTLKGKTSSYNYSATFRTVGKAVGVDITISKSSPVDLSATISGTLDNLSSSGSIGVHGQKLSSARMVANGLKGEFKVSYSIKPLSAFGLGAAGNIKITLPAEITVPFSVDGIPFFIGIKTAFFASVGFSGFDQAVNGSYTVTYSGSGGFSTASSGATSPSGALHGLGEILLNAANAVNTGPLSVVFGAQVPQIELGLGVKGLNVAGFVTLIANTGVATFGSGCDTRGLLVQGSAGAEANFFGLSTSLGSVTLFKKELSGAFPAGCGTFPGF